MNGISQAEEYSVSTPDLPAESEHELHWRLWREKCRRSDRIAERRMKVVFWGVVATVAALILYVYFRPHALAEDTEPTVARVQFSIGITRPRRPFVTPHSEELRCPHKRVQGLTLSLTPN